MNGVLAEVANGYLHVVLRAAPAVTLQGAECWRADGNSPVRIDEDGITVFFSAYEPRGHTYRRRGDRNWRFNSPSVAIRLLDDPAPLIGKWIEAIWRDAAGVLHGWYHAEEPAPGNARLFVAHIGEAISQDDGFTWRYRGELLRSPAGEVDTSWRNGFFGGGFGDLCVVPHRIDNRLYMAFSSYLADEHMQGVIMARMPAIRPEVVSEGMEIWGANGWQPAAGGAPRPLWPMTRGWRHADPEGFWGPALHYNRALDAHVMLLNSTAGGAGDLVQEGVYVSVNRHLEDPAGWSPPMRLVQGGAWYPQVVGLEAGSGDTEAAARGRFFMGGFSAWSIEFSRPRAAGEIAHPLRPTKADFTGLFGLDRRCPW